MILTKKIKIKTTNKNITYYQNIGFNVNSGDIINICPEQLPPTSIKKIDVKCDICGKEKSISMFSYRRNINEYNFYACSTKCSEFKTKQTSIKKYGVEHYNKTDESKNRIKKTKKDRYGNEKYVNIEKQKQTNLIKYGFESYMQTDDFKINKDKILLEKYNTTIPLKNEQIKEKWIKTNIEKYGKITPLLNDKIKEKIKETKKLKYNDVYYNNRKKYKITCIDNFGEDNPMKNENIKDIFYKNFYKKYGERHPMHVPEIVDKMIKSGLKISKYKDTNIYYQSSYEKDFLDKYYNYITIERGKSIKYNYKNKEHIYYPDFFIPEINLLIEIKSTNWFNMHKEKNIIKKKTCIEKGFNFLFIIDKDYETFNKLIKYKLYQFEDVCYQYKIKNDIKLKENNNIKKVNVSDFEFKYIDSTNKIMCNRIKNFIEKYEWLGKMPNRPTHRFIALHKNEIGAVIVMSTPNSFSKILGENTKDIEKLISRGANAFWTPKNLSSSLIMWSIKWMVKNTQFRLFSAYSDIEAKEIGTIYQACNFIYLGQKYGSDYVYFDLDNPNIGWTTGRNFRKLSYYKKLCKNNNIKWVDDWNKKYSILWKNIPNDISSFLLKTSQNKIKSLIKRKTPKKHKYIYILGENRKETKKLHKKFKELNPKLINLPYPKR